MTLKNFCDAIENEFSDFEDLCIRIFCDDKGNDYVVVAIDHLSDRLYIASTIITPIISNTARDNVPDKVGNSQIYPLHDLESAYGVILEGNAVIYSDAESKFYGALARNEEFRGIENAGVEEVVRGPHDSFIEDGATNVSLVRRRLRTSLLKCVKIKVGKLSKTDVYIMYLENVADKSILESLKKRIENCDLKTIHDSGTLEMAISDGKFSLFPVIGNTERPDKAAAKISEGRIALFVDGSPVVLTVPELYIETLQCSDDYSKAPQYASFARILRFFAVGVSLFLPSVYLSILEFHQSMLPKKLLETLSQERLNVPYSIFAELLLMLIIFDIIREVGQRMPRTMGSVVSLVAGIVLGEAAMRAGLVSAPTLMAVAFTATCAYVSPPVTWCNILLKFVFVFLSQLFGLFGTVLGFTFIISALASKSSFGVPYLSPLAPFIPSGIKDTLIKFKGGVQN